MKDGQYILLVEDAPDERDGVQIMLQLEGYRVVGLASGEEALAYMRAVSPLPCMIILDLMMHGTNGWEFRTEQLRDSRLAKVPVVVCSGDGQLSNKAETLGITEHLEKPIDPVALMAMVERHCA